MKNQIFSADVPISPSLIRELANAGALDEISNSPGSVRHHIFYFGMREEKTNKTQKSMLFAIYQTGRHGPQNGYRLCLVHRGYNIPSPDAARGEEDEIDVLERIIPQDHEEIVILGENLSASESDAI